MIAYVGRYGLFEVKPVEKKRPMGPGTAADKTFRAFDPHQVLVLPPLEDWLPQDHLASVRRRPGRRRAGPEPVLADYTDTRGYAPYGPSADAVASAHSRSMARPSKRATSPGSHPQPGEPMRSRH